MRQSIVSRLENLEQSQSLFSSRHLAKDGFSLYVDAPIADLKRTYIPNNTGIAFHSDPSIVRLLKGPYGSGKSTMCCAEIVIKACQMPVWCNGIRRARCIVVRNTSGELMTTTLSTWLHWFENMGEYKKRQKPVLTYEHLFRDEYGLVELEMLFLALDREDDVRKLKSLEATFAWVNEASEIHPAIFSHLKGRVGRYPSHSVCPDYWHGIIADTNPPPTDHWIYKTFEEEKPEQYVIFNQPPGLLTKNKEEVKDDEPQVKTALGNIYVMNPNADNAKHIHNKYYTELALGQTEEFIKVYCLGQYGTVILGKKVYPEYNDDFHSLDTVIPLPGLPIHLGWDFGLTPACVLMQQTARGQIRIFKEFCADDMGIKQFAESVIKPYFSTVLKDYQVGSSIGDPAGKTRADTDESTCMEILTGLGFRTDGAQTNSIIKRLESVKYCLNRIIDGQPAFIISRTDCPKLRKGFLGDYHYKRILVTGEERYRDEPNKNMFSHIHDALQYCIMDFCASELVNKSAIDKQKISRAVYNPAMRL